MSARKTFDLLTTARPTPVAANTWRARAPLFAAVFAWLAQLAPGPGSTTALADTPDPFAVRTLAAQSPRGNYDKSQQAAACSFAPTETGPLSLAEVVDRALCHSPQTRAAWANARVQAAQVGVARAAYLPTLSATLSASRNRSDAGAHDTALYNQEIAGLSAAYLLYDFGARDASLETALQTLAAANATQDATLQKVFLGAVQAYYQLFATRAAVDSAVEAERAALEGVKAATARYDAGSGTPADKLQAQTAYSQAVLNRIQAEGNWKSAEGALANAMGMDANRTLSYAAPRVSAPDDQFDQNLDRLIAAARASRPDLAAAEAQLKAAQANVRTVRAQGLPSIALSTSFNYADSGISDLSRNSTIGVAISIPLFTGFNSTYRVRVAEAQVESQMAQRDAVNLQVALDVWQAYQSLSTGTQAVRSSADLLASASASERVAFGRYKAGAGTIIDLLTAQSSLASARLQNIQALYNWYVYKATLAQAIGQLDFGALNAPGNKR
jgi:outer membrane protein